MTAGSDIQKEEKDPGVRVHRRTRGTQVGYHYSEHVIVLLEFPQGRLHVRLLEKMRCACTVPQRPSHLEAASIYVRKSITLICTDKHQMSSLTVSVNQCCHSLSSTLI